MNKNEIDNHFVKIIPILNKIAEGIKYKQHRQHLTRDTIINEAYLHLIKNSKSIENENMLQRIAIQFIKMNIIWENSQLNKMERVNNNDDFYNNEDDDDDFNNNKTIKKNVPIEIEIDEIEKKIELEKKYEILKKYREQEEDKINQIIYDCYFVKGLNNNKELATHLNLKNNVTWQYVKVLKQAITKYVKQQ